MQVAPASLHFLEQEAHALLTRLNRVKPFALQMTSVLAAAVSPGAQTAIERHMERCRNALARRVREFIAWLRTSVREFVTPAEAQSRFCILRLRFISVLTQFDIFADALVQRSEQEYGTWLGGLDAVAADALALPEFYEAPPVVCYLDRGVGAAIRRARTRLPGGTENPVAIIRVPRERMVGSSIASSLVHEVGHQAAALLDLVNSFRPVLQARQRSRSEGAVAWSFWERWISEILADLWSVAKVGVTSSAGLIGVVSLPRAFVFRINLNDPHPFPWIRVKTSCAMGKALYPHPQWDQLADIWERFYPREGLDDRRQELLEKLEGTLPEFVDALLNHQPESLRGRALGNVLAQEERSPEHLRALGAEWRQTPALMREAKPTLAFAVIGQARLDGMITPQQESVWLSRLLTLWALRGTLDMSELCSSYALRRIGHPQV